MDPEIRNSRAIRESILRMLYNAFQSSPDIRVRADDIYAGFSTGEIQHDRHEINAELADLMADQLIVVEDIPSVSPVTKKGYKLTSRGRDFVRARFPWGRVDEYTGDKKAM